MSRPNFFIVGAFDDIVIADDLGVPERRHRQVLVGLLTDRGALSIDPAGLLDVDVEDRGHDPHAAQLVREHDLAIVDACCLANPLKF